MVKKKSKTVSPYFSVSVQITFRPFARREDLVPLNQPTHKYTFVLLSFALVGGICDDCSSAIALEHLGYSEVEYIVKYAA